MGHLLRTIQHSSSHLGEMKTLLLLSVLTLILQNIDCQCFSGSASKTCWKWESDGTKIVTTYKLTKRSDCSCVISEGAIITYPDGSGKGPYRIYCDDNGENGRCGCEIPSTCPN